MAGDQGSPLGGPVDAEQQPDRGRFSGPIGAEETVHLAPSDIEVKVIERQRRAIPLGESGRLYHCCHRPLPAVPALRPTIETTPDYRVCDR